MRRTGDDSEGSNVAIVCVCVCVCQAMEKVQIGKICQHVVWLYGDSYSHPTKKKTQINK